MTDLGGAQAIDGVCVCDMLATKNDVAVLSMFFAAQINLPFVFAVIDLLCWLT